MLGGGFGLFFSGVGVIPSSLLWGATVLLELALVTFFCCKERKSKEFNRPQQNEEMDKEQAAIALTRASQPAFKATLSNLKCQNLVHPAFDDPKIMQLRSSSGKQGLELQSGRYISPAHEHKDETIHPNSTLRLSDGSTYNSSIMTKQIYLAAGPQNADECHPFWQHIYDIVKERKEVMIVMATGTVEERVNSNWEKEQTQVCETYWPVNEKFKYGSFSIEQVDDFNSEAYGHFRTFKLQTESGQNVISQLVFDGWSSYEVYSPIELEKHIKFAVCKENAVLVVHDDDSKGRAAVFAICLMLKAIHISATKCGMQATVDLDQLLHRLRTDREFGCYGIVNSSAQYDTIVSYAKHLAEQEW